MGLRLLSIAWGGLDFSDLDDIGILLGKYAALMMRMRFKII